MQRININVAAYKAFQELVEVKEEDLKAGVREATQKIFNFLWWMKKQGYAEASIKSLGEILRRLLRLGADLDDPELVRAMIARQKWSEGRKANVVYAYDCSADGLGSNGLHPEYPSLKSCPSFPWNVK